MEPTPRIERNTCTLIELVTLVCVIEAERWAAEKLGDILRTGDKPEARGADNTPEARRTQFSAVPRMSNTLNAPRKSGNSETRPTRNTPDTQCTSFVNQERIRRARAHGTSPAWGNGPARGNGSARRNISAQR